MFLDFRTVANPNSVIYLYVLNPPRFRGEQLRKWLRNVEVFAHNANAEANADDTVWIPKTIVDIQTPLRSFSDTPFEKRRYCVVMMNPSGLIIENGMGATHYKVIREKRARGSSSSSASAKTVFLDWCGIFVFGALVAAITMSFGILAGEPGARQISIKTIGG